MSRRPSDTERLPEGAVVLALEGLGVEVLREDGDELIALCPGHESRTGKKDSNPSWSINAESGVHYCFSCHYRGNLITLIGDISGRDAADQFRTEFETHKRGLIEDPELNVLTDIAKPTVAPVRSVNFQPEWWLNKFVDPPRWALKARRISAIGAKEYGVLWDDANDAWIFPFRDPNTDRLLGYQKKYQGTRLFRNKPRSIPKSETFFGWAAVRGRNKVVVVESPLDAVLLADMGAPAIAICGSRLSDAQENLLMDHPTFTVVYLWLDHDTAGSKENERLQKALMKAGVRAEFITAEAYPEVGSGKDVGELSDSTIEAVLDGAGV